VIAAILVIVPLGAALLGGALGDRFHRAVDQAGFAEPEPEFPPPSEHEPVAEAETEAMPDTEPETETPPR
jgi:hypothetical protein